MSIHSFVGQRNTKAHEGLDEKKQAFEGKKPKHIKILDAAEDTSICQC